MRGVGLVLAAMVWAAAGTALAEPVIPAGAVVTQPGWRVVPNGADLSEQYPAVAQFIGLPGRALLRCEIAIDGSASCKVIDETPAGLGFGDAALAFSKTFKMKPMTVDGQPVDGGEIKIPLKFAAPDEDEAAADASPAVTAAVAALAPGASTSSVEPSAKATALARKIAAATLGQAGVKPFKDLARTALVKQFGGPKLTAAEKAALDDYVEALGATMDARIAAMGDSYAQVFSEKELGAIDGFFESSSGRAWLERSASLAAKVDVNLESAILADARKRFCGQFKCEAAPAPGDSAPGK
jgi:TonB family protein